MKVWPGILTFVLIAGALIETQSAFAGDFPQRYPQTFINKIQNTQCVNAGALKQWMQSRSQQRKRQPYLFELPNPYYPRSSVWSVEEANDLAVQSHRPRPALSIKNHSSDTGGEYFGNDETVSWWFSLKSQQEVCALKFIDQAEKQYQLKTFQSAEEAQKQGYTITHFSRCGACSSLSDLGVYMMENLTEAARSCARLPIVQMMKNCLKTKVGLSDSCSEAWAYNMNHTRKHCSAVCLKEYGLVDLLLNNLSGKDYTFNGRLSECLKCDETISGMGFQALAGRIRRNSGLRSEIERSPGEIATLTHDYFKK